MEESIVAKSVHNILDLVDSLSENIDILYDQVEEYELSQQELLKSAENQQDTYVQQRASLSRDIDRMIDCIDIIHRRASNFGEKHLQCLKTSNDIKMSILFAEKRR